MKDYYDLLGVSKNATTDEIKKAFNRLAFKYHPDRPDGDEKKFKEINEAYQILNNPETRSRYDQFGQAGVSGAGSNYGPNVNWSNADFDFDINDLFSSFFTGGATRQSHRKRSEHKYKGQDQEMELEINLEEAALGAEKEISFRTYIKCASCQGKGHEPNSGFKTCSKCHGEGVIRETRRTFLGEFAQITDCSVCRGTGKVSEKTCKTCGGDGRLYATKKIKINIPAGIRSQEVMRINGAGEAGQYGNTSGDLLIVIKIKPHNLFRREGDDLFCDLKINFTEAVLGTEKNISLIDKKTVSLTIPEGIESGSILKLKNKGIKHINSIGQGDLYVRVKIDTPKKVSRQMRELLERLEKEL